MTEVIVFGGACRFETKITARLEDETVKLKIESDCDMVKELGKKLKEISYHDLFPGEGHASLFRNNIVYVIAEECLKHVDCPVPCGILKASLAEFGLQLKKSPEIRFI
ncbi:MAG: DUF6951 family protein [Candidatus Syntropharchaeia archaeon]